MAKPYGEDVSDWLQSQAELLRLKRFAELDLDHLVAELWAGWMNARTACGRSWCRS
jgi:hypothetical protein